MNRFMKNFIKGMGSILEIYPDSRHSKCYDRLYKSPQDALRKDWENVGKDMWSALGKYEYKGKS